MDVITLVSLLNVATLSIAVLGGLMFIGTPAYRGVCVLLGLVSVAALANLLEDLHISRELHLISPIFVVGYGPALYIAVQKLIGGSVNYKGKCSYQRPNSYQAMWHFLPMLLVLPFTAHVQSIIAVGTLWRVVYALLTLKLIIDFNRQLTAKRSDASEVSLAWLGWLIGVATLFSALDLLRLNFQPELGEQLNMLGYAANRFIFFIVLLLLILILNYRRSALETLAGSTTATQVPSVTSSVTTTSPVSNPDSGKSEESAADYQSLFAILDSELRTNHWYCLPRLTLNQLSDLSGMSPRDISRCINLVAGLSFNDYINQYRIEKIKTELQTDANTNLTDLAFAAGFSSKATFNQSFKKATGMTPSEFRSTQHVQNHASSRLVSGD